MMKNAFYFTLKALFVLKVFSFLSWLFGPVEERLDWKDKVDFKIHDIETWLANNCNTHISNISKSKAHKTVKFGRLIEYDTRIIFLENHTQNVGEELFSDPFLKNQNWSYLWINSLKFYTVCFYCMAKSRAAKIYWN